VIDESQFPPGLPVPDKEDWRRLRDEALEQGFEGTPWLDLCAHLAWAAELDRRGLSESKSINQRVTAEYSLRKVIAFLQASNFVLFYNGTGPLLRLHTALKDLNEGYVAPVLQPTQKKSGNPGHRVPDPLVALCARAMDEWMKAGDERRHAALRVATAVDHRRYPNITWTTVANWRAGCQAGPGGRVSNEAVAEFNRPLPPQLGDTPARRARVLMNMIRNFPF
jgi:hypothetical protein